MKKAPVKTILVQIYLFLIAGVAFPGDEPDKPVGTSQATYHVKLTNGTILEVSSYRFQCNYVAFVLSDGQVFPGGCCAWSGRASEGLL